eukprot:scaffold15816_cov70-Cyclotella_meneghiniana.AAC.10
MSDESQSEVLRATPFIVEEDITRFILLCCYGSPVSYLFSCVVVGLLVVVVGCCLSSIYELRDLGRLSEACFCCGVSRCVVFFRHWIALDLKLRYWVGDERPEDVQCTGINTKK